MSEQSIILGFDPGNAGAVAALALDGPALWAEPLPLLKGKRPELDIAPLVRRLCLDRDRIRLAVLEQVGASSNISGRRQGAVSMFKFGRGVGRIEGILGALWLPLELVTPQRWKAEVLAGTDKSKAAAVAYVSRRFPSISLIPKGCRVPHEGMAEAICLAEFGRRLVAREIDAA